MIDSNRMTRRGFTLAEILVVVVILGIASAIIVPQISQRNDLKAAAAARVVVADLIYAQNRSIALQKMHYLKFTPAAGSAAGSYQVLDAISPANVITHPVNKSTYVTTFGASGTPGLAGCLLGSASLNGQLTLAFDELGTPYAYNAGTGTLTALTSGAITVKSGAYTLTVSIEPYTGEISVN